MAIDPFVLLAPVLLLAVIALLRFVGCLTKPSLSANPIDVTFDNPPPPGNPMDPLKVPYKNLDFGVDQWFWQGPTGLEGANSISINTGNASPASRQFSFTNNAKRVLLRMKVYVQIDGDFTLTDDQGQTFNSGSIQATDPPKLHDTGWTKPSSTVTVSSSIGWDLLIDTITYQA